MMAWLQEPSVSWEKHFVREAIRAEEADHLLNEYLRGQDEKWANGTLPSPLLAWGWSPEKIAEFERSEIEYAKTEYITPSEDMPAMRNSPPNPWNGFTM